MKQQQDIREFADFHFGYVSTYIQLADSKAGVLATATAALMGFLLSRAEFQRALGGSPVTTDWLLGSATIVALGLAFPFAFYVITPRATKSKTGPVFYSDVAEYPSPSAFLDDLQQRGPAGIVECRIAHCYDLARVCAAKYRHLRRASISAGMGAMLAAVAFVKLAIWRLLSAAITRHA